MQTFIWTLKNVEKKTGHVVQNALVIQQRYYLKYKITFPLSNFIFENKSHEMDKFEYYVGAEFAKLVGVGARFANYPYNYDRSPSNR